MIATKNNITEISFDQYFMYLQLDGRCYKIPLEAVSSKLREAKEFERNIYKFSPAGYGIHWPLLDEDLSVEYLLKAAV